jgi:phosphoribosylglycinamide formyltransferase-1
MTSAISGTIPLVIIGILASHTGTTAQAVIDACESSVIAGEVGVVISNNHDAQVLERARSSGIPAVCLSRGEYPDPVELDEAIVRTFRLHSVDVVLLAGYLCKVGPATLGAFDGRIVNTHPALLPRHGGQGMYGTAVHEAVLASGDRESGATVHIVTPDYDSGPILAQRTVPVEPGDDVQTLQARIQDVERALVVQTLACMAREKSATQ